MNILFISSEYPPQTGHGGIGTYTFHVSLQLALMGHNVHVIAAQNIGTEKSCVINGVTVHRILPQNYPLPKSNFLFPFRKICYKLLPHTLIRLSWINAVQKKVQSLFGNGYQFDIIEYPECGAEGLRVNCPESCAKIARLHTPWEIVRKYDLMPEPPGDKLLLPLLERLSVSRADGVSTPSYALGKLMESRWKLKNTSVIPNPIPVKMFPQSSGTGWIYTGRIERRKGVHILIKAYNKICEKFNPPPLKIIGHEYGILPDNTSYGDYIRKLISESKFSNKIEWIDHCEQEQLKKFLSESSVAFFPSLWENFPYSCLEAMASGVAVAVSDCGGFPEIVDHKKDGLIINTGDIDSWENAMELLITNKDLEKALQHSGYKKVLWKFDSVDICKKMESFYFEILRRKKHGITTRFQIN
ncbi:MAG: glycosyltransferase family 4 protein [Fibrobacter sp.]|nr:glycosyltransferase family 4 protein [Fibrobacter sp.]